MWETCSGALSGNIYSVVEHRYWTNKEGIEAVDIR